jgi:acetyl/propionyl-CoA carboxylase alpha subunit
VRVAAYFEREGDERSALFNGEFFRARLVRTGAGAVVFTRGERFLLASPGASREHGGLEAGDEVTAPLPGKVVAVQAKAGAAVKRGDPLVTLEAMKMEHALKAPRDGAIAEVAVASGAQVKEGALLVRLEPPAA